MSSKSFKELKVWQLSREVRKDIFTLSKQLPNDEKYKLVDQMIRCSRGIGANIAEGQGRFHFQENIQFCRIARGSNEELLDHLVSALDCNYISKEVFESISNKCDEIGRMLNGYINYLKKQKAQA